jgi:plasmid stabilization system protein ParE
LAHIELSKVAGEDIERLIRVLSLPNDTRKRIRDSIRLLESFPRLGSEMFGRWQGLRFILGPWRWMLLIYRYDEVGDRVIVVGVHDARPSSAATYG